MKTCIILIVEDKRIESLNKEYDSSELLPTIKEQREKTLKLYELIACHHEIRSSKLHYSL